MQVMYVLLYLAHLLPYEKHHEHHDNPVENNIEDSFEKIHKNPFEKPRELTHVLHVPHALHNATRLLYHVHALTSLI